MSIRFSDSIGLLVSLQYRDQLEDTDHNEGSRKTGTLMCYLYGLTLGSHVGSMEFESLSFQMMQKSRLQLMRETTQWDMFQLKKTVKRHLFQNHKRRDIVLPNVTNLTQTVAQKYSLQIWKH